MVEYPNAFQLKKESSEHYACFLCEKQSEQKPENKFIFQTDMHRY